MKKLSTLFSTLMVFCLCYHSASAQIGNYCSSNANYTGDSKIDTVMLNTINQASNPTTCEQYTDNTSISTNLRAGSAYTISVANGSCGSYYTNYKRAWIDFDKNGQFDDPAERIIDVTSSFAGHLQSNTFNVPANAQSGTTYMRVVSSESSNPSPCGTFNWGETEDYSIFIQSSASNDAGVTSVVEPSTGGCEGTYNVKVKLANIGINQITSVQVNWTVNGTPQTTFTYSQLLDTLDGTGPNTAVVNVGTIGLTGGMDTLVFWTDMPNSQSDTSNLNDTVATYVSSLPLVETFPYYEDFETGEASWHIEGNNASWAFGTPAKTNISSAASGVNAFVTGGLNSSYSNNEQSWVGSPCFDLSGTEGQVWVALDANWYSESSYDGAVLQYSTDGGSTWTRVGSSGDDYNWYNRSGLGGTPGGQDQAWAGTGSNSSGGWVKAKHTLPPAALKKNVQFRLAFGSDGSVTYEGFAFDNFTIVDFKEADLGPDKISMCGNTTIELDPHVNFYGTMMWSTGDSTETILHNLQDTVWVTYHDTLLDLETSDTVLIVQSTPPIINFSELTYTIALQDKLILDPETDFDLLYEWQPGGYDFPFLLVRGSDLGVGTHQFELTVTDSLLCKDNNIVTVIVKDITGIDELQNALLSLYPNPVKDILNIRMDQFDQGSLTLQITDLQGKVLVSQLINHVNNGQAYRMDVSNLPAGVYLLSAHNDKKSAFARIIVN